MTFGLSTHLFHGEPLMASHVERIRAHDFEIIEIFATRTHVDYHDAAAVAEVRRWLDGTGVRAWSVHAPICDGFVNGVWGRAYSNATPDAAGRREAVDETARAAEAAAAWGAEVIVLHLGIPRGQPIPAGDNDAGALARSLEPIAAACTAAGVRLALEVIPNDLATPDALLRWLEGDLELGAAGVCLDVGHAHLVGGAPEAAEELAGYLLTTHIHDNRGQADDHLVPFAGTIDWSSTMMALVKVGYTGPLIFELPDHGDAAGVLTAAVGARRRLQRILDDLESPLAFE